MAGLTAEGFERLRFPEVLANIVASEQANIDPNINTQDDELIGQLNNIIASALADQWALAEAVNDNFNPLKAEGKNLDDLGAIVGVYRLDSTPSTTTEQLFVGTEGSVVAATTLLESSSTGLRFITTTATAAAKAACYGVNFSLTAVANNTSYGVTIDGTAYTFLSDANATATEILNGLKADIDADGSRTCEIDVNLTDETLFIYTNSIEPIAVTGLVTIIDDNVVARASASSQDSGTISAPINTVNTLVLGVAGIASTYNNLAYVLGTEVETDEDYRARILVSQQVSGAATVPAIEDALSALSGVLSTSIVENRTFAVDGDGRPAKSFEAFVQGGLDSEVAQELWDKKPAGIETFGNTTVGVLDSRGNSQNINFSRPVAVHMAFQITYSLNPEETLPSGGEGAIKDAVKVFTDDLGVDGDVIPTRYYGVAYGATSGIEISSIEIQVLAASGDAPNGGSWSTAKQSIELVEFAATETVDIYFVVV